MPPNRALVNAKCKKVMIRVSSNEASISKLALLSTVKERMRLDNGMVVGDLIGDLVYMDEFK